MKTKLYSLFFVGLLVLAACDQAPQSAKGAPDNSSLNTKLGNTNKSYHFTSIQEGCHTYQRVFSSTHDMCWGLQVDAINNSCALAERQEYFKIYCEPQLQWSGSDYAKLKIKHSKRSFVECELSETHQLPISQFTNSRELIMYHTTTRAAIMQSYSDGLFSLSMQLFDITTNRLLARIQKQWKDQAPAPWTLSAPQHLNSPQLTCLVQLGQNTDNDSLN